MPSSLFLVSKFLLFSSVFNTRLQEIIHLWGFTAFNAKIHAFTEKLPRKHFRIWKIESPTMGEFVLIHVRGAY